ncbi:MAG TPA: hypothetical protein VK211_11420, partial [Kamptonema sp.]|nr:hypothetical protein [Kamptonema sp.]
IARDITRRGRWGRWGRWGWGRGGRMGEDGEDGKKGIASRVSGNQNVPNRLGGCYTYFPLSKPEKVA